MLLRNNKIAIILALAALSQVACYNTYFISKSELQKLESAVEPRVVVPVYADCSSMYLSYRSLSSLDGTHWAQGYDNPAMRSDGTQAPDASADGCVEVPVSTANAVRVKTSDGYYHRVTPFNFVMSDSQLVSPEYDLLLNLNEVEGAEVKQFSTWKTLATIIGVSTVAVGTFVGISVLAPEGGGFE